MKPWKFWLALVAACGVTAFVPFAIGQTSKGWALASFVVGLVVVVALRAMSWFKSRKPPEDKDRHFDTTPTDVISLDDHRPTGVDGTDPPRAA